MEKKNDELTKKQKEIYNYLCLRYKRFGMNPTFSELSKELNRSRSTIYGMLSRLSNKGYVMLVHKKRGIQVLMEGLDLNDKRIEFRPDDFEKEKYDKYGLSKRNKQSRRSFWR